jgi:hypothetical protein
MSLTAHRTGTVVVEGSTPPPDRTGGQPPGRACLDMDRSGSAMISTMSLFADTASVGTIVFLDADVLRDIADALDGRWLPDQEPNPIRRARFLAAARLRLYGEPDRSGWRLVCSRAERERAATRGDTNWTFAAITEVDAFEDAPPAEDVQGLIRMYRGQDVGPEAATALAHAVLWEPVRYLVTIDKRPYRHSRDDDLRDGLELLTVGDAVDLLGLVKGEEPLHAPPADSALGKQPAWWVPR